MDYKSEGNRLFQAGQLRRAKQAYTEGLRSASRTDALLQAQLLSNRAAVHLRLKEYAKAEKDATRAAELAPQWAKPHMRLAEVSSSLGQYRNAVLRLEEALGIATAAFDAGLVKEIKHKLSQYRLHEHQGASTASSPDEGGFQAASGDSEPMDPTIKSLMSMITGGGDFESAKHVRRGQQAIEGDRLLDAAREFKTAALAGNPDGMHYYATMLLNGHGVNTNIPEAAKWLEKAAAMADSKAQGTGIAAALSTLGHMYNDGIHYAQDKVRACQYWERAAKRGDVSASNQLAKCLSQGTHGVQKDLPRARDLLRQGAEAFDNIAMIELADLHESLQDYETAARWADTAFAFGVLSACNDAQEYRELAQAKERMPGNMVEKIAQFTLMLRDLTSTHTEEQTNRVPALEELQAIDMPYGKRLLFAKQKMIEAGSFVDLDLSKMTSVVQLAAEALRIEDSHLVFTAEELRHASLAANFLLEAGVELNAELALCMKVSDPSSVVSFWKSMQLKFPDDLTITRKTASACMLSGYAGVDRDFALRLFHKAMSLLPRPDDDSDPATLGLLYSTGVALFKTIQFPRAQTLLSRFVGHAATDGHRKAAEAHFLLGIMALQKGANSGLKQNYDSILKRSEADARKHLDQGIALEDRMPAFLREQHESQYRQYLESYLDVISMATSFPGTQSPETEELLPKRGGELLPGPRRHPKLRSETSFLTMKWRKCTAMYAKMMNCYGTNVRAATSAPPNPSAATARAQSAVPATIDELFSALKDQVYEGRSIECLLVSTPMFTGSSYHMVVEDSQRESTRMTVYDATPSLVKQLLPGQALTLLNPYVRIAADGSTVLRVNDPSDTILLKAKHSICWVCSVEEQAEHPLSSCSKCHKAFYCSRKCQQQDWTVDGHRFMCAMLKKS